MPTVIISPGQKHSGRQNKVLEDYGYSGGSGATSLSELSDVSLTNLKKNQYLQYDKDNAVWKNVDPFTLPFIMFDYDTTHNYFDLTKAQYDDILAGRLGVQISDKSDVTKDWPVYRFVSITQEPALQAGGNTYFSRSVITYESNLYVGALKIVRYAATPSMPERYGVGFSKSLLIPDTPEGVRIIRFDSDSIEGSYILPEDLEYVATASTIIRTPEYTYHFDRDLGDEIIYRTIPRGSNITGSIYAQHEDYWTIKINPVDGEITEQFCTRLNGEMYCVELSTIPTTITATEFNDIASYRAYVRYTGLNFYLAGRSDTVLSLESCIGPISNSDKAFVFLMTITKSGTGINVIAESHDFMLVPRATNNDKGKSVVVDPSDAGKLGFANVQGFEYMEVSDGQTLTSAEYSRISVVKEHLALIDTDDQVVTYYYMEDDSNIYFTGVCPYRSTTENEPPQYWICTIGINKTSHAVGIGYSEDSVIIPPHNNTDGLVLTSKASSAGGYETEWKSLGMAPVKDISSSVGATSAAGDVSCYICGNVVSLSFQVPQAHTGSTKTAFFTNLPKPKRHIYMSGGCYDGSASTFNGIGSAILWGASDTEGAPGTLEGSNEAAWCKFNVCYITEDLR